jgi:hypothetical protein
VTFEWGHVMMLLRSDRRALHDILAGTRVMTRKRNLAVSRETNGNGDTAANDEGQGEEVKGEKVQS